MTTKNISKSIDELVLELGLELSFENIQMRGLKARADCFIILGVAKGL